MKKPTSPSSKSVAAALGVSVATISRVLTRPDLVNEETRERVLRGIDRLGYRPNLAARDLRRGQTSTVLVVVPVLASFFLDILRGVEQAADERDFAVLMANTRADPNREATYFDQVASQRADGIILLTGQLPPGAASSSRNLPPLVLAAEGMANSNIPTVAVDHAGGAEEAVRHLLNLGHRRIAHLAGPDSVLSAGARLSGYRKALRAARVPFDETLVHRGYFTVESGSIGMHTLLRQHRPPTAVLCANDQMAIGAIRALASVGLRVPEDFSVVGFDDGELAEVYAPPLTTVRIPRFDVGYQSMMMLADLLSQKGPIRSLTLATRLVVRGTSMAPQSR